MRSSGLEGNWTGTTLGPQGVSAAQGARGAAPLCLSRIVTALAPELLRAMKRVPNLNLTQQLTVDCRKTDASPNTAPMAVKTHRGKPDIISGSYYQEKSGKT